MAIPLTEVEKTALLNEYSRRGMPLWSGDPRIACTKGDHHGCKGLVWDSLTDADVPCECDCHKVAAMREP